MLLMVLMMILLMMRLMMLLMLLGVTTNAAATAAGSRIFPSGAELRVEGGCYNRVNFSFHSDRYLSA